MMLPTSRIADLDSLSGTGPELAIKELLQRQLSTSRRFEKVEFQEVTASTQPIDYYSGGLSSLPKLAQSQLAQEKLEKEPSVEIKEGGSSYKHDSTSRDIQKFIKRRRYGADPSVISNVKSDAQHNTRRISQHDTEKALFLQNVKQRELKEQYKQEIAGSGARMALAGLANNTDGLIGLTPEDRARATTDARPIEEVFSEQAPEVFDFQYYLLNREQSSNPVAHITGPEPTSSFGICKSRFEEISEEEILQNRLSSVEIQKLPDGKFVNCTPGNPSEVLYIKNLSKEVTETDLLALFLRFQKAQEQPLLFRLMKRGRMKGQAFVTFSDKETSSRARGLLNGYVLKGKPMIIEFGNRQGRENFSSKRM